MPANIRRIISDLFSYWYGNLFPEPSGDWWTGAPERDRRDFVASLFDRALDQWFDDEYLYPRDVSPKRNPAAALLYGLSYLDGYRPGSGSEFKRQALPVAKVRSTELAAAIGVNTVMLAGLLRDAGVSGPRQMRFPGGGNTKGYRKSHLKDAWQHDDGHFQSEIIRIATEQGESVHQMRENFEAVLHLVRNHPDPGSLTA